MIQKLILFLSATLLLSACSSNFGLMKRRYTRGYYVSSARHHQAAKQAEPATATVKQQPQPASHRSPETAVANAPEATVSQVQVTLPEQVIALPNSSSKKAAHPTAKQAKQEKKQESLSAVQLLKEPVKQEKNLEKMADDDAKLIIMVILCLFPFINLIAIYMHDNDITLNFWITLILDFTFIGGIIFSLLVVLDIVDLR